MTRQLFSFYLQNASLQTSWEPQATAALFTVSLSGEYVTFLVAVWGWTEQFNTYMKDIKKLRY